MGEAVAQHAAREWLRRRRNAAERTSTLAELADEALFAADADPEVLARAAQLLALAR